MKQSFDVAYGKSPSRLDNNGHAKNNPRGLKMPGPKVYSELDMIGAVFQLYIWMIAWYYDEGKIFSLDLRDSNIHSSRVESYYPLYS